MLEIRVFKNCNGEIITDTLKIARDFANGRHDHVMSKIKGLEISQDFGTLNFKPVEYKDARNRTQTKYELTKDGFMMLVMHYQGFTDIKEQYIKEYSEMEKYIIDTKQQEVFNLWRKQEAKSHHRNHKDAEKLGISEWYLKRINVLLYSTVQYKFNLKSIGSKDHIINKDSNEQSVFYAELRGFAYNQVKLHKKRYGKVNLNILKEELDMFSDLEVKEIA